MSTETDTRDRVIRLEAEVAQQTKTIEAMADKVDAMHSLIMQAKGARWAILAAASVGGFIAAKLSFLFPWFPGR